MFLATVFSIFKTKFTPLPVVPSSLEHAFIPSLQLFKAGLVLLYIVSSFKSKNKSYKNMHRNMGQISSYIYLIQKL